LHCGEFTIWITILYLGEVSAHRCGSIAPAIFALQRCFLLDSELLLEVQSIIVIVLIEVLMCLLVIVWLLNLVFVFFKNAFHGGLPIVLRRYLFPKVATLRSNYFALVCSAFTSFDLLYWTLAFLTVQLGSLLLLWFVTD